MEGLAPLDGWAIAAIAVKAAGYLAALLAIGGPLFLTMFATAPTGVLRRARQVTLMACLCGLAIVVVRLGLRAGRIGGMGLPGMADPVMLGFVWNSPFGTVMLLREAGYVAVLIGLLVQRPWGRWMTVAGSLALALSFAQIGHVAGATDPVLAGALAAHVLVAGVWIAALLPLIRAADTPDGAAILHRFGQVAALGVPLLLLAGLVLSWHLSGGMAALVGTAYGTALIVKVCAVATLLALAAQNKLRLVPAIAAGTPGAAARLRQSIRAEAAVFVAILTATAAITTVTTPPVNL